MPAKLSADEIVTLEVLHDKGQSNCQIVQTLGVTDGAVRYHLRRQGVADGRRNKARKADALTEAIAHWFDTQEHDAPSGERDGQRPPNIYALHDWLCREHGYTGSYKSVLRFVRARYPRPRLRPFRRVESRRRLRHQVDWGEFSDLDVGEGPQKLYALVLVLSHSRKEVLVWSRCMDQLSWHHAHNEALSRLGGVPAVLRIDNLQTGIVRGAGPWGEVNDAILPDQAEPIQTEPDLLHGIGRLPLCPPFRVPHDTLSASAAVTLWTTD